MPWRQGRRCPAGTSPRTRRDRPARHARGDGRRARAPAEAARPLRRSRAAAGHSPHATPLRVSQDLGGMQPPLHLLHHPHHARQTTKLSNGASSF